MKFYPNKTTNMRNNIYKTQSIYKGHIGPKVILSTISTLLFGFQRCSEGVSNLSSKDSNDSSFIAYASSTHKKTSNDAISSLKDACSHFLGVISYCKRDHHFGLIQIDPANQCSQTESQKMGLLFYASRSLKDCADVRLSNQEVTVSYLDGSSEVLSIFIEIQSEWMDGLFKEKEPLFHKDSCSKLDATCTNDFTILSALEYGIESFNDMNSIVLLEGRQDKTRFKDINHAGFMVIKCIPITTSELVQLVRHLATNTLASTNAICSASVCGNRLQPAAGASGDVAYGYIKSGNRYRLIPLSGSASSGKGCQDSGAMHSVAMRQVGILNPEQGAQEEAAVKAKTSDISVQTGDSLCTEDSLYNDYEQYNFNGESWEGDSDEDSDTNSYTSEIEPDIESIKNSIFDQDLDEEDSFKNPGLHSDHQKEDNDDDEQKEEVAYNSDLVKRCDNNAKNYFSISSLFSEAYQNE